MTNFMALYETLAKHGSEQILEITRWRIFYIIH